MDDTLTTPTTGLAVQKLAKQKFLEKKRAAASVDYKKGEATDKVWDNYQLTKELKRQFKDLCRSKNINASKYLRACVRLLIKKDGDIKKSLEAVKKLDSKAIKE
jgi:hypothetical protein